MIIRRSISTKFLTNPFCVYPISFLLALLIFSLKWSYLYQRIDTSLIVFLTVTSVISLILGFSVRKRSYFNYIPKDKNNFKFFVFIFLGNIAEYVYCKSIPIVAVVFSGIGNYKDFEGIPTFHVLLSGISFFWGAYVFHQYQSNTKDKPLLFYSLFTYLPNLLLLNRGGIILILISHLLIYLMKIERIKLRHILRGIVGFILFISLFGIVGNARNDSSQEDSTYILKLGGATDEFIESNVPKTFYWGYLYIASPIGNLQNVLDVTNPSPSFSNFMTVVFNQTIPDFVSKRLTFIFPMYLDIEDYLVTPLLNAPTVYFVSYLLNGWIGMIYMFVFMIFIVYAYIKLIKTNSPYFLTGWSYLITIISLNVFSNMWYYNGLFIISIPIIFYYLKKVKVRKTNI